MQYILYSIVHVVKTTLTDNISLYIYSTLHPHRLKKKYIIYV